MKDDYIYLADILERIEPIKFSTKEGKEAFYTSLLIQDGVIRCFEVIGEAVKQLSPIISEKYSKITWRKIASFRDVLIYNYMGIDVDEVWGVIENFLPILKQPIIAIIENEQD